MNDEQQTITYPADYLRNFATEVFLYFGVPKTGVSVSNTNHLGIAGYYPLKALERDLIGWAMTNSAKLVAPLWGTQRMLGTNPIAIAFPGNKEPPIVIDMATSAVSYGKIEVALRKKQLVPKGWIVDKEGRDTTNPQDLIDGGAQLPLGSEREMGAMRKADSLSQMSAYPVPYTGVRFVGIPEFQSIGTTVGQNSAGALAGKMSVERLKHREELP
jgi:hypothetical protein